MSSQAKVGLFFLSAVILTGVIAMYLGDFWVRAASDEMTAYFKDVQGLPSGSEVRFAGVRIGKVVAVGLEDQAQFPGRPAAVRMAIFRNTVLYDTDTFLVQQGALLGDKYVEVRRAPGKARRRLGKDSKVAGGESTSLVGLTDEAKLLVKEARQSLATVRAAIATDFTRDAVRMILTNVVMTTRRADRLSAQALELAIILKQTAAKSGPDVTALARNLRESSVSVKSTAQLVRQILATSPVPRDMATASGNVAKATGDLAAVSDNMAKVLADPKTRDRLDSLMTNLQTTSENLSKLTTRADDLLGDEQFEADVRAALTSLRVSAANLADASAAAKALLQDPQVNEDLRGTIREGRRLVATGAEAVVKADRSLDRVDRTIGRVGELTDSIRPTAVRSRATLEANADAGLRADYEFDLQYGPQHDNFWRIGVRDVGDAETISLQRAWPVGRGSRARAGSMGNQLGVGYDFWLDRRLGIEADLYDPNDLRLDLRALYGLSANSDLLFGVTKVGAGTEPFIGVRIRSSR